MNTTTTTSYFTYQQLALSIPKVVKHILSFLPRQKAVRLVCKEWYAICKELIPVHFILTLHLNPSDTNRDNGYQSLATEISLAENLIIRIDDTSQSTTSSPRRLALWTKMMGILSDIVRECDQRREQPRLRFLRLEMGVLESIDVQVPQLPQLLYLVTLRIDMVDRWDIIHLFTIFKACPNLEELIFRPTRAAKQVFRHAFTKKFLQGLTLDEYLATVNGSYALPTLRQLRTCILYHVRITLPVLEALLQASPHLSKLVLAQCTHDAQPPRYLYIYEQTARVIKVVSKHCPEIKSFHISENPDNLCGLLHVNVASIIDSFPNLDEYNFMDWDILRSSLVSGLRTVANRVTTLNILPYEQSITRYDIPIREILCTFVHLRHLRAPNAVYNLEDMDLNYMHGQFRDGWNASNQDERPTSRLNSDVGRYLWVCRGLKTLHMTIAPLKARHMISPELSFILFGFLSRMCPRLTELYLTGWVLDLSFQSGLCLLTRLQDLERIRIVTNNDHQLNERALFWIQQSPTTLFAWDYHLNYRLQRHRTLKRCDDYLGVAPHEVMAARSDVIKRGREMGTDLSRIGHPNDLLEWMDCRYEMSGSAAASASRADEGCQNEKIKEGSLLLAWPKLESFWVESRGTQAYFKKAERYMARVRPNVEFGLHRTPQSPYYQTTLRYL
ncbi:hypothetical protein BGZ95_004352 [Linnemannia exigua]|uniref:F-box domain-containing protein n=1 Tax=Linnemannia exigua TaxID=604196 RepID=A0AAD4D3K9_9FUNG|nr:hypothetical protein BGZ95_004352 [Linnemannia exigua]